MNLRSLILYLCTIFSVFLCGVVVGVAVTHKKDTRAETCQLQKERLELENLKLKIELLKKELK